MAANAPQRTPCLSSRDTCSAGTDGFLGKDLANESSTRLPLPCTSFSREQRQLTNKDEREQADITAEEDRGQQGQPTSHGAGTALDSEPLGAPGVRWALAFPLAASKDNSSPNRQPSLTTRSSGRRTPSPSGDLHKRSRCELKAKSGSRGNSHASRHRALNTAATSQTLEGVMNRVPWLHVSQQRKNATTNGVSGVFVKGGKKKSRQ